MSEKQFSSNPVMNELFTDTAERIRQETGEVIESTVELEAEGNPVIRVRPPVTRERVEVEVAPGIMVSEHLIRAAVEATSTGDSPQDHQDYYRNLKLRDKKHQEEVRKDLNASKKFVKEMFDRLNNPPNMKEKYISFDAMPKPLQRVVKAYSAAAEANKELEEAIKALASAPPTE